MDNVTHTLAGLTLAEAAVQLRARRAGAAPPPGIRTAAAIASAIGANLPDADLFYTGVGGDRLAYILHHRGHTHTVLLALIGAALVWAMTLAVGRWRGRTPVARPEASWLAGLLVAAILSHLVLDWTNSYGVHPFWPFDDRWFYGDAVFIVEPWFWAVTVPALAAASRRRAARLLLWAVLGLGVVLAWTVGMVPWWAALALTLGAGGSALAARTLRPGPRIAVAVAGWVAVTLVMAAGASAARRHLVAAARAADPAVEVVDVSLSPLPTNPLCASAIVVETSGDAYRVATASAAALPALVPIGACRDRWDHEGGPTFRPSARTSTRAVRWNAEWSAPRAQLAALARESCPALAALRFIRAPIWRPVGADSVMIGDARFGDASGGGLADLVVPRRSRACPDAVPSWHPPRAGLFTE